MNLFNLVKQKVAILDIVTNYSSLKKTGSYWKGQCPFHHDKTPSFTVSPQKEIFYCFGCQTGGDVISFISKVENCSQYDAAKLLIEQFNIAIPENIWKKNNNPEEKQHYIHICTTLAEWFHNKLIKNSQAKNYLASRGISSDSIKKFVLGYFPSGQESIKELLQYSKKNNILLQDLIDAHIIMKIDYNLYSPFEERIIFPLKDNLGRVLGFGGRIIRENDNRAKYYNSHEHKYFYKGSFLFGLDKAKKDIQKKEFVFLVEGYLDVIAMNQHNYENTVATLGTSCSSEHIKLLSRYTQILYVMYDNDKAGQKAILRLAELCWGENIELYVIILPTSEDPASYLQKNQSLESFISNAQSIFDFFIHQTGIDFEKQTLQQRIFLIRKLLNIITKIKDKLKQDLLLKKVAETLNIPLETLKKEMYSIKDFSTTLNNAHSIKKIESQNNLPSESQPSVKKNKITLLEKSIFYAILDNDRILPEEDVMLLEQWLPEQLQSIFEKIILIKRSNKNDKGIHSLFELLTEYEKNELSKLIIEIENNESRPALDYLLHNFYKKQWKVTIQKIKVEINEARKKGETDKVSELISYIDGLRKRMFKRGIL